MAMAHGELAYDQWSVIDYVAYAGGDSSRVATDKFTAIIEIYLIAKFWPILAIRRHCKVGGPFPATPKTLRITVLRKRCWMPDSSPGANWEAGSGSSDRFASGLDIYRCPNLARACLTVRGMLGGGLIHDAM
jgi:hypothetical protein